MASIIVRYRASSIQWFRLIRTKSFTQGNSYRATPALRNINLCLQPNYRNFSAAACSRYPRLSRGRRNRNEEFTMRHGKDILSQVQEVLDKAANTVAEADNDIIKQLGQNASYETYVKLVLSRLRPFLIYVIHLGPEKFIKGYAPPTSSLARARNATVFLFISAHAWLFRAMVALSSRSPEIPPPTLQVAKKFTTAGNAVEAYVENKLPKGMGWAEVGGAILDSSSDAWHVMSKSVSQEDGTTGPSNNHDPSKPKDSPDKGDDIT